MPFVLTAVGLILIVTGIRDTHTQLGRQLVSDFTGQQNFTVWVLAIGSVGALGYVSELRTFSRFFLALIIIAMVLSQKGFFQKFSQQFNAGPTLPAGSGAGSASTLTPAPATLTQQQSGAFGQTPADSGQSKFNGWVNYLLGGGWLK